MQSATPPQAAVSLSHAWLVAAPMYPFYYSITLSVSLTAATSLHLPSPPHHPRLLYPPSLQFPMVAETVCTSSICLFLGLAGLWLAMPKAHRDHDFRANVVRTLFAASCLKVPRPWACFGDCCPGLLCRIGGQSLQPQLAHHLARSCLAGHRRFRVCASVATTRNEASVAVCRRLQ